MPIQKFRSLKEAEEALWCDSPDEAYLERLERWWAIVRQLQPRSFPTGIFKYHNTEEANQAREQWQANALLPVEKNEQNRVHPYGADGE